MGSSKTEKSSFKPPIVDKMAEERNTIIGTLKKAFKWTKKSKKQEKIAEKSPNIEEKQRIPPPIISPKVTSVNELINKRDKHEDDESEVFTRYEVAEERNRKIVGDARENQKAEKDEKQKIDELEAFKSLTISVRSDRKLNSRLDSQVSDESGFHEKMSGDETTSSETNLTCNQEVTKTDKTKEVFLDKCDKESGDKRNNQNVQLPNDDKDISDMFNKLVISDKEKKVERDPKSNKKLQMLSVSRGPQPKKRDHKIVPYSRPTQPQIEEQEVINPSCLSGGHFTVVKDTTITTGTPGGEVSYAGTEDLACTELNGALDSVDRSVEDHMNTSKSILLSDVEAYLAEKAHTEEAGNVPELNNEFSMPEVLSPEMDIIEIFQNYANGYTETYGEINEYDGLTPAVDPRTQMLHDNMDPLNSGFVGNYINSYSPPNDFLHSNSKAQFNVANQIDDLILPTTSSSYLTPPYSDNAYSPGSDQTSIWRPSTSPNTSYSSNFGNVSPLNNCASPFDISGLETFQNIPDIQDHQLEANERFQEIPQIEKKETKMKKTEYKQMNNRLTEEFSKRECCLTEGKNSEEILNYCKKAFVEHIKKLTEKERRAICLEVAKISFDASCRMLCYILKEAMFSNVSNESFNIVLFSLLCEKLLLTNPQVFLTEIAVDLINYAIDCNARLLLTRYLVYCVRAASNQQDTDKPIFDKVIGNKNPLHACVSRGDACADALGELVRRAPRRPPLFDVNQTNSDGFTPLHACCGAHTAECPRLLCAHVLLKHGAASIRTEDVKGGDTPLHIALTSHCDLRFVITLFNQIDYKDWSKYKGIVNRSQKTALQLARDARRSSSIHGIAPGVMDFLTKISR